MLKTVHVFSVGVSMFGTPTQDSLSDLERRMGRPADGGDFTDLTDSSLGLVCWDYALKSDAKKARRVALGHPGVDYVYVRERMVPRAESTRSRAG